MGLDIYTGTLTRYYTHNWKTVTEVWCEKYGYTYNVVGNEDVGEKLSPEETLEITTEWQQQILSGLKDVLGEVPAWNEDYEQTPYYTEKPDWDALNALLLYISAKMTDEIVPEIVNKNFDLYEHPLYKKFLSEQKSAFSLFHGDGWWLPIKDAFIFKYPLPTGTENIISTVGMLKNELEAINNLEWKADKETILSWISTEGYPTDSVIENDGTVKDIANHEQYDTISLAKFAFAILYNMVEFSLKNGTPIIYDY